MTVRSWCPYAIEECAVKRAMRGLRSHTSLTVSDITDPPMCPNHLAVTPLSASITEVLLAYFRDVFRQSHSPVSR